MLLISSVQDDTHTWCPRATRLKLFFWRKDNTISPPNVHDTPRSFSPQPVISYNKQHIRNIGNNTEETIFLHIPALKKLRLRRLSNNFFLVRRYIDSLPHLDQTKANHWPIHSPVCQLVFQNFESKWLEHNILLQVYKVRYVYLNKDQEFNNCIVVKCREK